MHRALSQQRVAEIVGEVEAELLGREHSLIDQGAARQAREVEVLVIVEPRVFDLFFKPLADDIELPLEPIGVADRAAAADEGVPHHRLDRPGALAQRAGVGLDAPPAEKLLPFLGDDPLEVIHADISAAILPAT